MKKRILSIIALFALTLGLNAQNKDNPNSIGVHFGTIEYAGDIGYEMFNFKDVHGAFGLSYSRYLNASFDGMFSANYGLVDYSRNNKSFQSKLGDIKLELKYKLNNGYLLKEDAFFAPYIHAGFGNSIYSGTHVNNGNRPDLKLGFPIGLGVMFNISEKFAVSLNSTYTQMTTDEFDGVNQNALAGNYTDRFLFSAVGLNFNFGKTSDRDGDGIVDKKDACPDVAGPIENDGCPDTDGDGIVDKFDKCPTVAGLADFDGCPDIDGDGIADNEDNCPEVIGTKEMKGCPDSDGDGIADKEDRCPEVAGTAEFGGCPDTDGDGIADIDDACPQVKGSKEMKGCPDTDGDGIADNLDKCPDVAGIAANKGCPEIKKEDAKIMEMAMKGLFFETGSSKIKTSSFKVLDNIVKVMQANPTYNLMIEGHTDSQGDVDKNLGLSKDRAKAAKDYLTNKGIDVSRLNSEGYGVTRPKADNKTAAGRAQNRRVEFTIKF